MMIEVSRGCAYRDRIGIARVMAVADGYAMMKRYRGEPFVVSLKGLSIGWQREPTKDSGRRKR